MKSLYCEKRTLPLGTIYPLILITCAFLSFSCNTEKEAPPSTQKVIPIKISQVISTEFADFVEAVGTTFAHRSADITSNVTEVIDSIYFTDGQAVKKGDVIVVLRSAEENALLESARTNLMEQEREIKRLTGLVKNGAAAVSALDARNTQKALAEQQIQQYQAQISDRIIRAPFDGVLGLRNINEGALVSPQNLITTIDDLNTIHVDFTVPEIYLGQLKRGLPVKARSQAYRDESFSGSIKEVDTRVDPTSRAVKVRAQIPNINQMLKPGMLLYIQLALEKAASPTIPERSAIQEGHKQYVFKLNKNEVERTEIQLGRRKPGYVEVVSGLANGDSVATSGLQDLESGMKVAIQGKFDGPSETQNPERYAE
ncbi:efflux RND transporter periplasmic adaptor subunit [Membranihabitans maritimus]|uniref:efflux RND transporter periplasmic adaptor subunit n=1 Tax=Membranihabitans maritimus TaxID=2904244 RepID=UPI001F020752